MKTPQVGIRERIAKIQHGIWTHWMTYLFNVCIQNEDGSYTIPVEKVSRWQRQMKTQYEDLTEAEKDSDREQADRLIPMLKDVQS